MTDQYYNNYWTLQTKKENYDGYAGGTWHLSDSGKLFADLLFGFDHLQNNTRGPSFTSPDFINASSGDLERWYRLFSPEEIGGKSSNNSKWREVSWTGTLGYSDRVANTSWEYELAATRLSTAATALPATPRRPGSSTCTWAASSANAMATRSTIPIRRASDVR